mgnify:CR=1 FL=1
MQELCVQLLGWEDPLEEEMATHSSILVWKIPWTEESCGLQSMESQRLGHDRVTNTDMHADQSQYQVKENTSLNLQSSFMMKASL